MEKEKKTGSAKLKTGKVLLIVAALFTALILITVLSRKSAASDVSGQRTLRSAAEGSAAGGGGRSAEAGAANTAGGGGSVGGSGRGAEGGAAGAARTGGSAGEGGRGGEAGRRGAEEAGGGRTRNQTGGGGAEGGGSQAGGRGTVERAAPLVRAETVRLGTIENSIIITGELIALKQVSLYPQIAGKITSLRKRVGDQVYVNELVAAIDPSRPGEFFQASPLRSTISGAVTQAPFSTGDTVSTNSAVYVISDLSELAVESYVPERFAGNIKKGQNAALRFDALPDEVWTGSVDELSPVLDPATRSLRIRLRIKSNDERLRAGMFAQLNLVINSRSGILVIKRDSIINTYGKWVAFVVDEGGIARRKELQLGLENDTEVEVISGLEAGERIVTSGQFFLSNNEPVRISD